MNITQKSKRVFLVEYSIVSVKEWKNSEWLYIEEWLKECGYRYTNWNIGGNLDTFIQEVCFTSSAASTLFKLTWIE